MTGKKGKSLLDITGKPGARKDELLEKLARIPKGYTHIGIANTDIGITVVAAHEEWVRPLIYDPQTKAWVELKTKTKGGLIV